MQTWPVDPIATVKMQWGWEPVRSPLGVIWHQDGGSFFFSDPDMEWNIALEFYDDGESYMSGYELGERPEDFRGYGEFIGKLFKVPLDNNGLLSNYDQVSSTDSFELIQEETIRLGDGTRSGVFRGIMSLRATLDAPHVQYAIQIEGTLGGYTDPRNWQGGTAAPLSNKRFFANAAESYIGGFSLDYFPISIVYCCPGQDMSASLTLTQSFGTRFTIGTSEGFSTTQGTSVQMDIGVVSAGESTTESRSSENQSTSGTQISFFKTSVLTADNQRAIGREFWGPLGDIFCIGVGGRYQLTQTADGRILAQNISIDNILTLPAHKLLRPDGDPIARQIPPEIRLRLLELDPFITNLNQFFFSRGGQLVDLGEDLLNAVDPEAVPANNRAELVGRWQPGIGTEITYSAGEERQLFSGEANEVAFETTVSNFFAVSVNAASSVINAIGSPIGLSFGGSVSYQESFTTSLRYQSSRETTSTVYKNAACFLIRNQNAQDLSAIEIYYDKIFSTFMFRKIPVPADNTIITGIIRDLYGAFVKNTRVNLVGRDGNTLAALTDSKGQYIFYGAPPGPAKLEVGNIREDINIKKPSSGISNSQTVNVNNVKRVLDFENSPAWEMARTLKASSDDIWRISRNREGIFDLEDVAALLKKKPRELNDLKNNVAVRWPETDLSKIKGLSKANINALKNAKVNSIQSLWNTAKKRDGIKKLSDKSGIEIKIIKKLLDKAESNRIINRRS